jgi:hypothetical protein
MTTLNNPHDRFFKTVFGRTEVAAEFRSSGDSLLNSLQEAALEQLETWSERVLEAGTLREVRDATDAAANDPHP